MFFFGDFFFFGFFFGEFSKGREGRHTGSDVELRI